MGVPEASAGQFGQDTRKCDWLHRLMLLVPAKLYWPRRQRQRARCMGSCMVMPGSSELAGCRHELRSRPVILRNAWSEPKENKVDPGRHCAGSGQTVRETR